jgi:hypothetical protein
MHCVKQNKTEKTCRSAINTCIRKLVKLEKESSKIENKLNGASRFITVHLLQLILQYWSKIRLKRFRIFGELFPYHSCASV